MNAITNSFSILQVGENVNLDTLNPDISTDDESSTSSSESTSSTNSSTSSDDSSSSINLARKRIRKRNGRTRTKAKFSKIEFNRLENERDMRRKINKLHPYPGHNSGLSVFNTIDVYDITFGTDPDQLDIVDWNLGTGRLSMLRTFKDEVIQTSDDDDTNSVDNHLSEKQSSCPCCRNVGTDRQRMSY